ncbi:membrane protein [Bordetella ansorpii]|uniref:Membrane protein n=1 Tax=Bordetella ansorpii TaxID=288768 RepID=A0A157S8X2_9BORD|nr:hypothetical protein [Bordetella ansorpii]SAI66857.1 membrane protein [Bordetella ansorpii]
MSATAGYSTQRNPFAGAAPLAYRPLSAIAATTAGGVPQSRIKRVLAELVAPLQALHNQGLIRADISMHSVGLDETGRAHLMTVSGPPYIAEPPSGVPEPGYAPPELYATGPQWPRGPWTDVYALAAVAHSLVTGMRPPPASERLDEDTYRPLAQRDLAKYDTGFLRALDVALSVDPRNRPQTLEEFAQQMDIPATLLTSAAEPPLPMPPPAPPAVVQPEPARAGWRTFLLIVLVLTVGAGVGVYWWNRFAAPPGSLIITRSEVSPPGTPQSVDPMRGSPRAGGASPATPAAEDGDPPEPPGLATLSARALDAETRTEDGPAAQSDAGRDDEEGKPEESEATEPPAPPIASPAPWVRVRVNIHPWGELWVNGVRRGVSPPLKEIRLAPGQYSVVVRNANLPPYRGTLTVKEGRQSVLSYSFD